MFYRWVEKNREFEPARNNAAPAQAPAVIFKTGSGFSILKEEKHFGLNFQNVFQESYIFQKQSFVVKIVF